MTGGTEESGSDRKRTREKGKAEWNLATSRNRKVNFNHNINNTNKVSPIALHTKRIFITEDECRIRQKENEIKIYIKEFRRKRT